MAAFPHVTIFFLVSYTLTHVFSGVLKRDYSRWPKPPCKMYRPVDPTSDCPNVTAPVCARDGRTYQNECFFCVAQWNFGREHIQFDKYGKCG
uniref:Serine peptidase inhibitor Kazal type 13 n=1 Tax=Rhinolophus ferrumequinum TaxID=59479 RepID=A0A671EXL4_RHIFE